MTTTGNYFQRGKAPHLPLLTWVVGADEIQLQHFVSLIWDTEKQTLFSNRSILIFQSQKD